jgi:hypothetical protein
VRAPAHHRIHKSTHRHVKVPVPCALHQSAKRKQMLAIGWLARAQHGMKAIERHMGQKHDSYTCLRSEGLKAGSSLYGSKGGECCWGTAFACPKAPWYVLGAKLAMTSNADLYETHVNRCSNATKSMRGNT